MEKQELLTLVRANFKTQWRGTESVWLFKVHDPEAIRIGISKKQGIYLAHHRQAGEIHLWVTTARLQESLHIKTNHVPVWRLSPENFEWHEIPNLEHVYDEWWKLNEGSINYLTSLGEQKYNG